MTYYYIRQDSILITLTHCVVSGDEISFSLPAEVEAVRECLIVDEEGCTYSVILIRFTGTNDDRQVNGMVTLKEPHPKKNLVLDAIGKHRRASQDDANL